MSHVQGPIFESISWLDNLGMSIIEEVRCCIHHPEGQVQE